STTDAMVESPRRQVALSSRRLRRLEPCGLFGVPLPGRRGTVRRWRLAGRFWLLLALAPPAIAVPPAHRNILRDEGVRSTWPLFLAAHANGLLNPPKSSQGVRNPKP